MSQIVLMSNAAVLPAVVGFGLVILRLVGFSRRGN